jgi:hypothetical protein
MSEMIERVAKAVFEVSAPYADDCCTQPDFEKCKTCAEDARRQARAAIESMRQPADDQRNNYYKLSHNLSVMMDAHWERAIDAALGEDLG